MVVVVIVVFRVGPMIDAEIILPLDRHIMVSDRIEQSDVAIIDPAPGR